MTQQWRFLTSLFIIIATSACGFKPINSAGTETLLAISLQPSKVDSASHKLAWEFDKILAAELHHGETPINPRYTLTTTLSYETGSAVIQSNSTVSRSNIKLRLDYQLSDITTKKPVTKGYIRSATSFDIASSPFSNYVTDEESKRQLLTSIAADLRHRLYSLE